MNELLAFVKQKPLAPDAPNHCPACGSPEVKVLSAASTLVGGPNHHWNESVCLKCDFRYCYEFRDAETHPRSRPRNVWFTRRQDNGAHVLLGVPSCFEGYQYDCAACGGPVIRRHTDLSGKAVSSLTTRIENGRAVRMYRTFFDCTSCGASLETPDDHWRPS